MMTEEQHDLIDFINQEIDKWDDERRYVRVLEIALAALTQPASPTLRLPDAKPDHDSEDGNDIDYLEPSQVYALGVDDGFNRCLREVVKLNDPHTAPIEPTGGAEWVKCSERMPQSDDLRCLVFCQDRIIRTGFPSYGDWALNGKYYAPDYVSHWMPLPAAPED